MTDSTSSPGRQMRDLGLRPRKRLGQNFLRDRRYLRAILEAADITPEDTVLEVGPGTGVLTDALAERCRHVVAIELDDNLYGLLSTRFSDNPRVDIIHANALDIDPCDLFQSPHVLKAEITPENTARISDGSRLTAQSSKLGAQGSQLPSHVSGLESHVSYKLVANIPYYITGPLLRHFLEVKCRPVVLVLMVQKEVAARIAAEPGDLSLLGVSVQFYAQPKIMARVPATAFYPKPKVESAIVRLVPHRDQSSESLRDAFFTVARAGFSVRRKQLVNALQNGLGISREVAAYLLSESDLDPKRRAETLTLDEWKRLAEIYIRSSHE